MGDPIGRYRNTCTYAALSFVFYQVSEGQWVYNVPTWSVVLVAADAGAVVDLGLGCGPIYSKESNELKWEAC